MFFATPLPQKNIPLPQTKCGCGSLTDRSPPVNIINNIRTCLLSDISQFLKYITQRAQLQKNTLSDDSDLQYVIRQTYDKVKCPKITFCN